MTEVAWPYEFPGAYWLDQLEQDAVKDVLCDGSLFRYYGLQDPSYVDRFEEGAKAYYGCEYALAVNSGTGALIAAIRALDVGPGCEVIVPAFMWIATVGSVVQAGAIPVLCEVDASFSMDPADLEKKITQKTKLIICVHMAGMPCDMTSIMSVADAHGIAVLEDCAQCNGGEFGDKKVGTFGKLGIFSLQLNKNMTCGEGGLIITDDVALYDRAFAAHDMGLIRKDGRLSEPGPDALMWGGGRRMPELTGAVASVQLGKLPQIVEHMRASKKRIREMIGEIEGVELRHANDEEGDAGPFLILLLENTGKALAAVDHMKKVGMHNVFRIADYGLHIYYNMSSLVGKVGLSSAGNPWSLLENSESVYDYGKGSCPFSDGLFDRSVLIPVPSRLTAQQEEFAAKAVATATNL